MAGKTLDECLCEMHDYSTIICAASWNKSFSNFIHKCSKPRQAHIHGTDRSHYEWRIVEERRVEGEFNATPDTMYSQSL